MAALEVIDQVPRLREFLPDWAQFTRSSLATPFQTPEWLLTWWSHFGSGQLHVLVFRIAGTVVGVLPCFLHDWKGRHQLTLIGTGISDYLDPLFDPRHTATILETLQHHLTESGAWEICEWQDLSCATPLRALGPTVEDTPCCRLQLSETFEQFLASRPRHLRRSLRRYGENTPVGSRLRFSATYQADPNLLTTLIDLHGARWQKRGETGTIEQNGAAGFVRDAASALSGLDMLVMFSLHFDERAVAVILAFRHRSTIFVYLTAFDPEYEKFSFGRELVARSLQYAHSYGYRCWDFLRGDEPYKLLWGAQLVPKRRLILSNPAVRMATE